MFAIPKETYSSYALAYQAVKEAEFTAIAKGGLALAQKEEALVANIRKNV